MVSEVIRPTVVSFLDVMLRDTESPYRVCETTVQAGSALADIALGEADLKNRSGALVMAMRKPGADGFIYNPDAEELLTAGTTVVVLANVAQLENLKELTGEAEEHLTPGEAQRTRLGRDQ